MTHQDESLQVEILEDLTSAVNYRSWLIGKSLPGIGSRPFELGSGSGVYAEEIIREALGIESYTASEVSSLGIEKLKNKFHGQHLVSVIDLNLPYSPKILHSSFISWNVLEHIEDDVTALSLANQFCEDDSFVFAVVPAFPSLMSKFDSKIGHYRRYTTKSLSEKATQAGLVNVQVQYLNFFGWFGWFLLIKIFGGIPRNGLLLKVFDRFLVPVLSRLEDRIHVPFGQSVMLKARTKRALT
jgi:hypothetical protein